VVNHSVLVGRQWESPKPCLSRILDNIYFSLDFCMLCTFGSIIRSPPCLTGVKLKAVSEPNPGKRPFLFRFLHSVHFLVNHVVPPLCLAGVKLKDVSELNPGKPSFLFRFLLSVYFLINHGVPPLSGKVKLKAMSEPNPGKRPFLFRFLHSVHFLLYHEVPLLVGQVVPFQVSRFWDQTFNKIDPKSHSLSSEMTIFN
jgi:hypothetical protein